MARKRGRPPKSGERYDCGKLKSEGVSPTLAHRIREHAGKVGIDRRFGGELGRLLLLEQVTAGEAAAGWRVADIWHKFESTIGLQRDVRGASYDVGINRKMAALQSDHDEAEHIAREAWCSLDKHLQRNYPGYGGDRARSALETLCVDDRAIGWGALMEVRAMLHRLAVEHFGLTRAPKKQEGRLTAAAPVRRALWRSDYGADVAKLVSAANPDLGVERISEIRDFHNALIEREKFEAEKKRERSRASAVG